MNIIHFTHGKVNPFGESGMSRTVYYLNKHQKLEGHNSLIWSVVNGAKRHVTYKRDEYVSVEIFPRIISSASLRNNIINYLKKNNKIDLVHIHLMWMIDKNFLAHALAKLRIPYIVTTHGAYKTPTSQWKKWIAKYTYELSFLNAASAIHAISQEELSFLRQYGVKRPIFVVPNGIELEEITCNLSQSFNLYKDICEKIKIAWVGNLRPDKNLDGLIYASTMLTNDLKKNLAFIIIGPDIRNYASYLRNLIKKNKVEKLFHFVGPLYGTDKYSAIMASDLYIHPSKADVISFAVLDAMACSKPCIIARTCDVAYLFDKNFFLMVEPWPDDIARGITELLNRKSEWASMGANARRLIEKELNWYSISPRIIENYKQFAGV